jgi:hypothetical protein
MLFARADVASYMPAMLRRMCNEQAHCAGSLQRPRIGQHTRWPAAARQRYQEKHSWQCHPMEQCPLKAHLHTARSSFPSRCLQRSLPPCNMLGLAALTSCKMRPLMVKQLNSSPKRSIHGRPKCRRHSVWSYVAHSQERHVLMRPAHTRQPLSSQTRAQLLGFPSLAKRSHRGHT